MKDEKKLPLPAEQRLLPPQRDHRGTAMPARPPNAQKNREQDPAGHKEIVAGMALSTPVQCGSVVRAYTKDALGAFGNDLDVIALGHKLDDASANVAAGDLSALERMLVAHAIALETIFVNMTLRADLEPKLTAIERFLTLGLKAQPQARATILALVELKFPRQATFVKQQNVANGGPQQVNNGVEPARTGKTTRTQKNKLLVLGDGSTNMDIGAATAAKRGNPPMEPLGIVNRPAKRGRQGAGGA
jgi:hypothetical protein